MKRPRDRSNTLRTGPGDLGTLSANMQECQHLCTEAGIRFTFNIHSINFIQEMPLHLTRELFRTIPRVFFAAVANPRKCFGRPLLPKLLREGS